ncbi:MAG: MotA/TolQ/ExbB proton channel family protein [Planctomycetota bacterium]
MTILLRRGNRLRSDRSASYSSLLALLIAIVFAGLVVSSPTRAMAQDEDALAADILGEDVADPAPADPAAGDAQGEQQESEDDEGVTAPSNLLAWTFQALGIPYTVIFFALSITLLTLIVMNILASRQDNICPPDLIEGVEQQLGEGNAQGAAELIRTDESFLGQVVAAGLSKLDRGHSQAIESMQEVGEEETMKMDHNLSYMALIGNISPMIGLFGTVQGMIAAFRTIATSGSTPKPSQLAMDISTALFTTLAGLAIAIPAIAVYNILRNRVQRLTMQVGVTSEELLERFEG